MIERREFLGTITAGLALSGSAHGQPAARVESGSSSLTASRRAAGLVWTLFSRSLQWLFTAQFAHAHPYDAGVQVGEKAKALGFSAVDLTVRPDGLVDPGRDDLAVNLPAMLKGLRSAGVRCDQITPTVELADRPIGAISGRQVFPEDLLRIAAGNGVRLYRWGGFSYNVQPDAAGRPEPFGGQVLEQLRDFSARAAPLANLNRTLGLTALYHTFSGANGARSIWDLMAMLEPYPASELAINYDIGHMTREGALSAWSTNLRYAMPKVGGVALKDGALFKKPDGSVGSAFPPAGQGLVQWRPFFQLLLEGGFNGPAQAQYEFDAIGLKGQPVSFNTTFWADHPQFNSGNLSPQFMTTELLKDIRFYKDQAKQAGWRDDQLA